MASQQAEAAVLQCRTCGVSAAETALMSDVQPEGAGAPPSAPVCRMCLTLARKAKLLAAGELASAAQAVPSLKNALCAYCERGLPAVGCWLLDTSGGTQALLCSRNCLSVRQKTRKKVDKRRWERCESIRPIYDDEVTVRYCITPEEAEDAAADLVAWIKEHGITVIGFDTEGTSHLPRGGTENEPLGLLQLCTDAGSPRGKGWIFLFHLSRMSDKIGDRLVLLKPLPTLQGVLGDETIRKVGSGAHDSAPDVLRLQEAGLVVRGLMDTVAYGEMLSTRAEGLGMEQYVRRRCGFIRTAPMALQHYGIQTDSTYFKQKMHPCDWHEHLSGMHQRHAANNVWASLLVLRYLQQIERELGTPPVFLWIVRPSDSVLAAGGPVLRTADAINLSLAERKAARNAPELELLSPLLPVIDGLRLVYAAHCTAPGALDSVISIRVAVPAASGDALRAAGDDIIRRWGESGTLVAYTPTEVGRAHHVARISLQAHARAMDSDKPALLAAAREASPHHVALFLLAAASLPDVEPRHRVPQRRIRDTRT
eukprot:gene1948-2958_t